MASIFWFADGVGDVGSTATHLVRWIRTQSPSLIVYGGDVYGEGKATEFAQFFDQVDQNVADMCEVAGNHDWVSRSPASAPTGEIPIHYDAFWAAKAPPLSQQPIDASKRGGARYDHFKDIDGWRLVFLDTGPCKESPWPSGDQARIQWLKTALAPAGRAKIVFAHHSRLSKGKHGDIKKVSVLWETLFDPATEAPLVAMSVGGHDHNVSFYDPRPRRNPDNGSVAFSKGVHVLVNGAGGNGHDMPFFGTTPDWKDTKNYCVTRIDLASATQATVSVLSFGPNNPPNVTQPAVVKSFTLNV